MLVMEDILGGIDIKKEKVINIISLGWPNG